MEAAEFQNRSERNISAYRVACAVLKDGKIYFIEGPWMNPSQELAPGALQKVPAQAIRIDIQSEEMIFFMSDIRYADGNSWKADRRKVVQGNSHLQPRR